MGTMTSIRKDDWAPTPLVAPDGRTYKPGSYREHRQLLASGYREAPVAGADDGAPPTPGDTPIEPATAQPESDAADAAASAMLAGNTEPAPAAPEAASKTKTTRRNGGQQ